MAKLTCRVCGYQHPEPDPPETCPVCGSPRDRFVDPGETAAGTGSEAFSPPAGGESRRWRCTVCGYIHTGPEPPDKCPVCGADRSKFVPVEAPAADAAPSVPATSAEAEPGPARPGRRWRCTVCGYIHTGPEPPDKCPVCGADRSKFVPLEDETAEEKHAPSAGARPPAGETPRRRFYRLVTDKMVELHAHPISVHIPNGVAPVAVLFVLLAAICGSPTLSRAAFANMVVVLLAMPFVLFSGYNDWQRRFGGHLTNVFLGKMVCGGVFTVLSLWIVVWGLANPGVLESGGSGRAFYILLHLLLLAVGAFAGYLGGKLVFPAGGNGR